MRPARVLQFIWFGALLQSGFLWASGATNAEPTRPAGWAVELKKPGLLNFYRVNTNFYRGAQPTAEGIATLKAMGIRTVLNLRSFHSDDHIIAGSGLKQGRLHMKPWRAEDADVVAFLKLASDTNNFPIFVHCQRGADRTGMICAMYRVVFCGWTKDEAIHEMKEGGFHFNPSWKNLVDYVKQADVEKLKRAAGLPSTAEPEAPLPK